MNTLKIFVGLGYIVLLVAGWFISDPSIYSYAPILIAIYFLLLGIERYKEDKDHISPYLFFILAGTLVAFPIFIF